LPDLEHHTYSEDDVEEGGIKMENGHFFRAEVGKKVKKIFTFGCRKVRVKKYSPYDPKLPEFLMHFL
jgi:hypothetical protein